MPDGVDAAQPASAPRMSDRPMSDLTI